MEITLKDGRVGVIIPEKTACFTGHRPEKIPFDTNHKFYRDAISSVIYLHAYEAVGRGYDAFLCGMQRGIDVLAGLAILRLREVYGQIRLICVSPYRSEISSRKGKDLDEYSMLEERCDCFIALGEKYTPDCYRRRNEFMVDHSSLIIGAVADQRSGTGQTLRRAQKMGLTVERIDLVKFASDYFGITPNG